MILDYVALKVGQNNARQYEIITSLPLGFQAIYTTMMVDLEILNGGFNQYFWNRGEYAEKAVEGYVSIGAADHAHLMEEAMALYTAEAETHKKYRAQNSLEAFSESYKHTRLDELDHRYYALEDDPSQLRIQLVRRHPEVFAAQ